jgi:hypothetical protein
VANFLKKILGYVNDMVLYAMHNKERIIVYVDEAVERQIKEICQIPEEKIIIILDDSQCNDLHEIVVFTDKNIYWHMKDAYMKIKEENTEITVKGYGLIDNKKLNKVSVFSKSMNGIKYIYLIRSGV